ASPKSVIFGTHFSSGVSGPPASRTLAGLRSRWTTPASWAACTARASASTSAAATRGACGVPAARAASQPPPTNPSDKKGPPPWPPAPLTWAVVGCRHPRPRLRLALEAGAVLGPGVGPGQDHLQRDRPLQRRLPGPVDDAHAAPPQLPQHLVARDRRPPGRG